MLSFVVAAVLTLCRYHCNVDIGESAVKWKTIKDLGIDMEKIELRYGHHTGARRHDAAHSHRLPDAAHRLVAVLRYKATSTASFSLTRCIHAHAAR